MVATSENPVPSVLAAELAAAEHAARAAGAVLTQHYRHRDLLTVEQKDTNDFVSNADRDAERLIAEILISRFPADAFLGEETGLSGMETRQRIWCVDPLDGTTNFLKGAHNWCVSIGLWIDGSPSLGVIYDPLRDEMFAGIVGWGASCNGKPITVSDVEGLETASVGLGHNRRVAMDEFAHDISKVLGAGAGFRQVGAGALMLAYVAAGRVDGYFERHMWAWDAVAGLALIVAAGGAHAAYPQSDSDVALGGLVCAGNAELFLALADLTKSQSQREPPRG